MTDWNRSSSCKADSPMCVEVLRLTEKVAVRDSKDPSGPVLVFTHAEWAEFISGCVAGEFSVPD